MPKDGPIQFCILKICPLQFGGGKIAFKMVSLKLAPANSKIISFVLLFFILAIWEFFLGFKIF